MAAIDILDEDHSLEITFRRLSTDASLRKQLGARARQYWESHHRLEMMADDYHQLLNDHETTPTTSYSQIPVADNSIHNHVADLLYPFGVTPDILGPKGPA